ncbi:hypothetical protein [Ornithinimicrobium avium]|uniref:Uncharacterized protein n=1 Tax=Ornithinimicrobium avium TaxID=2283195 RepID=A0A345NKZ2_9MICO|nr:hypothetical protein [Ornithinimicrobium avium]AXH95700.1 hypothetical protein DV701_05810 [Ornithinimicrobium avium]
MSGPSSPGAPQQAAAPATQQQAAAPATQQQAAAPATQQQAAAPATQQQGTTAARGASQRSSSPARLRLARGLATAAALLTGVVATGTFDTSGINATPNVVAAQWQAAEQAGTQVAAADLELARTVARASAGDGVGSVDTAASADQLSAHLAGAAEELSRTGVTTSAGIVDLAVDGDRAVRAAAKDPKAAARAYQEMAEPTRTALDVTDEVARDRAQALKTGSRSMLTSLVGGLATLLLVGVMVWLALLTRRIVNVPLLLATAITAGLTYVSLNPAALPLDLDEQVTTRSATAQALQEVRVARAAQYAQVMDQGTADEAVTAATAALRVVGDRTLTEQWAQVYGAQQDLTKTDGSAERLAAVEAVQEQFTAVEGRLNEQVSSTDLTMGRWASVTAGLALVLGLVAAAAAWTGLTRRLRDYR